MYLYTLIPRVRHTSKPEITALDRVWLLGKHTKFVAGGQNSKMVVLVGRCYDRNLAIF